MALPRMIGLHGLARVGKDTLADLFVEREGFVKLAFADPLYQEVSTGFDVSVEDLRSDAWKAAPQGSLEIRRCKDPEFVSTMRQHGMFLDEPMTSRSILQMWGTEYRRRLYGDDYWVGKMVGRMRALREPSNIVFPDLRETVEAAMGHWKVSRGRYASFHIVEVTRPGRHTTGHSSDRGLSKFLIDATVRNTGTPEELYQATLEALAYGREERIDG